MYTWSGMTGRWALCVFFSMPFADLVYSITFWVRNSKLSLRCTKRTLHSPIFSRADTGTRCHRCQLVPWWSFVSTRWLWWYYEWVHTWNDCQRRPDQLCRSQGELLRVFSCSRGMHAYYVEEVGDYLTPLSCSSQHIQVMPSASHDVHVPARASTCTRTRPCRTYHTLVQPICEGRVFCWEAPSFASKQSRRNVPRGGNDRLNSTSRSAGCVNKQHTTYVAQRQWGQHDDSSRVNVKLGFGWMYLICGRSVGGRTCESVNTIADTLGASSLLGWIRPSPATEEGPFDCLTVEESTTAVIGTKLTHSYLASPPSGRSDCQRYQWRSWSTAVWIYQAIMYQDSY